MNLGGQPPTKSPGKRQRYPALAFPSQGCKLLAEKLKVQLLYWIASSWPDYVANVWPQRQQKALLLVALAGGTGIIEE
jgi:hypothetical protein